MGTPFVKPTEAACLAAVVRTFALNGRCTVDDVAKAVGVSKSTAHIYLPRLRDAGMVDWNRDRKGTLRPACVPSLV